MASNTIVNAAPMVIAHGTQDLSKRVAPREPLAYPQHLPKFYLYTEKGPVEEQIVSSAELLNVYGSKTLDVRSPFYNHQTLFADIALQNANMISVKRIVPEDAGPEANLVLWMDVLETVVDLYERNSDGSYRVNTLTGDPIRIGTTNGFKVKWVLTHLDDLESFGALTQTAGDQTDSTGAQSVRYPILQTKASSIGSHGNLAGIRLWAMNLNNSTSMPTKMMDTYKAYPYFMAVVRKPDAITSPAIQQTILGDQKIMVTMKEGTVDPLTEDATYIGDIAVDSYQNIKDTRHPLKHGDFSAIKVYQKNIDELVAKFHASEVPFIDANYDFGPETEDAHLFNFVTGTTSAAVPYHSFVFVTARDSVRLSEYENLMAKGGSDGTMTYEDHARLVEVQALRYLDESDELRNVAYHVESTVYDSGFPLSTKYALMSVLARPDMDFVGSTWQFGQDTLSMPAEMSSGTALRNRARTFAESEFFGTPTCRATLMTGSCRLRNHLWPHRVPKAIEVLIKSAKYMGAANGRWTDGQLFDMAPNNILEDTYDHSIPWVPASVRNRLWDVGLNWTSHYDRQSHQFQALKTVYDNDTSVLNSFFTMKAMCWTQKVIQAAHREYSGNMSLTGPQLVEKVNTFVAQRVKDAFNDKFVIIPRCEITDVDMLRGFSWTLPVDIYANPMRTVMTGYVRAYRMSDLAA